ncbi:MAG: hypothetical protein AB8G22_17550 [Saprospiraceae bacterium]
MEEFDTDKIDEYLLGRMPPTERAAFEQQLVNEPALAQYVTQQRDLLRGMKVYGDQQFATQLKQVDTELANEGFFLAEADLAKGIEAFGEQDFLANLNNVDSELETEGFFEEEKKKTATPTAKVVQMGRRRRLLSIAAAVGGLVIALWGVWTFTQPDNTFADNFTVYEDQLSPFLAETGFVRPDYIDNLQVGMQAYNQQNHTVAIQDFLNYLQAAPQDDQFYSFAQFYQAQSYLATEQIEFAVPLLEELMAGENFQLSEEVRWYLGLSYWQMDRREEAKKVWQPLRQSERYGERVKAF